MSTNISKSQTSTIKHTNSNPDETNLIPERPVHFPKLDHIPKVKRSQINAALLLQTETTLGQKQQSLENIQQEPNLKMKKVKTQESESPVIDSSYVPANQVYPEVFVNGIPLDSTEHDIKTHFKDCEIRSIKFLKTKKTVGFRPKCFLRLNNEESVQSALAYDETLFFGQKINVVPVKAHDPENMTKLDKIAQTIKSSTILVRKLPVALDESALEKLFSEFKNVVSARIVRETNGNSKGYGFVEFANCETAELALAKNGLEVCGSLIGVVLSVPKDVAQQSQNGKFKINRGNYFKKIDGEDSGKPQVKSVKSEFQGEFYDL